MKTIVSIVLAVIFSVGVYASVNAASTKQTSIAGNKFLVEILDVSSKYTVDKNGTHEMSSVFVASQNNSSVEMFGSFWAKFEIEAQNTSDLYKIKNWEVSDVRMAEDLTSEEKAQIKNAIYTELKERFNELPKVAINSTEKNEGLALNRAAPLIIYSNFPSALVVIDGDPYYEELDNRYSKISNAGAFLIKDGKKDMYYLYGGGLWYSSENPLKGWEYQEKVPSRITKVMRNHAPDLHDSMDDIQADSQIVPEIIVTSEPSELISTDGSPKYVVIPESILVYVENTDADLFRDITSNRFYSLFSGRWFTSDRLEGNWEFLAPEDLPLGFAKIPEDHDKSSVLASVPGTKAAIDAVRGAQVPDVTKKDISTLLDTEVEYNGDPEFVVIEGTDLKYAVNTSHPVMLWNNRYYIVEEAVWYNSSSPYGPWRIATQRPIGVEDIPADNPLFNLKYVYVYKQTDTEIYTGYTSGYTGSYVDGATVVYGTGYHYSGWYGHHYYHHHMTYGFGFYYHPFYGWGPYYSPWYHSSFYWHWHRPWFGYRPPYYRPPHHRPPGHRPPGNRPPHHRPKPEQPIARPDRPNSRPSQPTTRPTQPSTRPSQPSTRPSQPATRPSQPAYRPSQPSFRPSMPATRPSPGPSRMR